MVYFQFFYTLLYTRVHVCNCVHFTLFQPVDNFVDNFFVFFLLFFVGISKKGVILLVETLKHYQK